MKKSLVIAVLCVLTVGLGQFCSAQNAEGAGGVEAGGQPEQAQVDDKKRDRRADGKKKGQRDRMQHGERGGADRVEHMFTRLDKNKDGLISKDEAPEKLQPRLATMDANGDGNIDKAELTTAMKKAGQGKGEKGKGEKGRKGPGADGQARPAMTADKMLEHLDKNQDGTVSAEEAPARMQAHFAQMDANGDGSVDKAELQTMIDNRAARGGQGGKDGKGARDGKRGGGQEGKKGKKPNRPEGL